MSDRIFRRFMGKVPSNWEKHRIGDVVQLVDEPIRMADDEVYNLVSVRRAHGGLFNRGSLPGRQILTKTLRWAVPGTVVLARMQIVHGAIAYVTDEFAGSAISKSYSSFRARLGHDTRFLFWLFQHPMLRLYFLDASQGVVIEKMTFDQDRWLDFEIAVPPLGDQLRIRGTLDSLEAAISSSADVLAKLRLVKAGLSDELLELPDAPRVELSEIGAVSNGSTPSRSRPDYWTHGSVPWLASGKVNDYRIRKASEFITPKAVSESNLRIIPAGSVVIGMIGQGKTRGMSAFLEIDACINQNLAAVTPGPKVDGEYLHHALVHSYENLRSGGRGSNRDALNTGIVGSFRIPMPARHVQQSIARALTVLDERILSESDQIDKLKALRDGIADDLLMGRVQPTEVHG
ncbi:hypothetical protein GC088_10030 [Arthrobacter sp. JZ12]|uniref:restriction endonuclease subunit S n=1 Tax=Arthrobacter sp. JZ12 TaxID=2654190 RepID=UPI002B48BA97|nr:restriction endonuclease subunit S [Arthrobacter sp. JZ12]WRH25366.1 hypothetical protein GC088_10030 [Arthrobacter sp. JZ12]